VTYADTTPFDGWCLLLIAVPTGYTYATVNNQLVPQRIGDHIQVRVQKGVYDQSFRGYQTASLQPPNTRYYPLFYDNQGVALTTSATALVAINTGTYTLNVSDLTKPSAPVTPPTP
jgi:hypothetical protein